MHVAFDQHITFPPYSGLHYLMMPYVQGDPASVPDVYGPHNHRR